MAGVKCFEECPALDGYGGMPGQFLGSGIEVDPTDVVTGGPVLPGIDSSVESCKVPSFDVEGAVSLVVIFEAPGRTLESAVGVVASLPGRLMAGVELLVPVGTRSRLFGGVTQGSFEWAAGSPRAGRELESKAPGCVAVIVHRAACCGKRCSARRCRLDR